VVISLSLMLFLAFFSNTARAGLQWQHQQAAAEATALDGQVAVSYPFTNCDLLAALISAGGGCFAGKLPSDGVGEKARASALGAFPGLTSGCGPGPISDAMFGRCILDD